MSEQRSKQTVVALVENKPGVLNRVASMFRRRNFNMDSLTVGRTHQPHVSRMTIVIDGAEGMGNRIKANLHKLVNVIDVALVSDQPNISRDLALIKVRTNDVDSRNAVTAICEHYPARIVDIGTQVAIIEIAAQEDIVEALINELEPIGIVEMVRTGVVAMMRGTRILHAQYEPVKPAGQNGNGNGTYQVYGV